MGRSILDKDLTKQALTILVFIAIALSLIVVGFGVYLLGDSSVLNSAAVGSVIKEVPNYSQAYFNWVFDKIGGLI